MKILFTLSLIIFFLKPGFSQSYSSLSISDSIKAGADYVMRVEEISFEVSDIDRAQLTVHRVVTVLNKNAEDELSFVQLTNKYISLSDVDIRSYDAMGKEIEKYKKKDIHVQARYAEFVAEGMVHFLSITAPSYPITVEFNYTLTYSGTLRYPDYRIQMPNEGVEKSSMTVKVPRDIGIRFKERSVSLKPKLSEDGNSQVYNWSVSNLVPFKYELGSLMTEYVSPAIVLAPNKFRFYNTYGDLSSWKSFGEWELNLCKDLETLPADRIAFFSNLVKDAKTEREKIEMVYHYLQDNFRYVSIQLGIGGFKPFAASFTDNKKYGDCKALSFYTHSVLLSLGIKSYVALINSEYNNLPVDPAFPINDFNHMILCVPQVKDTIWLECTSKTNEFNFLSSFTENRYALLVTENGGVLVATPKSKSSDNLMNSVTHIQLSDDGSGSTKTEIKTKGHYNEEMLQMEDAKKEDQKEFIIRVWGFKQPDEYEITKRNKQSEVTDIVMSIEKIPQFTAGNKMFLNPRIYNLLAGKIPESPNRKNDFYFPTTFEKSDSTIYHLPEGYSADVLPKNTNKSSEFGSYNFSYSFNKEKNELISVAKVTLKQNRIPASRFAEVRSFFEQVYSDDNQKLVIKKD